MEKIIYVSFNIEDLQFVPNGWEKEIVKMADAFSYYTHLDGKSETSREPDNSEGTDVYIVEGNIIQRELNWLYQLYSNDILKIANLVFKNRYCISKDIYNSININYLKGVKSRYEWHVDSNPLTGLIFVTSHSSKEGGELVFDYKGNTIRIVPKKGMCILFDAREVPHAVMPLKVNTFRLSIPMNFYFEDKDQKRPKDLDNYLYTNPKGK